MELPRVLGRSLAEFVTIVSGVLLALAVDSCVERRNKRELEESYLSRLEAELRQDSSRIRTALEFLDRADSALVQLTRLRQAGGTPADPQRLVIDLTRARVRGLPGALSESTFDDLLSTGSIGLIRDPEVRAGIIDHYSFVARRRQILDTDYTHYPLAISEVVPGEVQNLVSRDITIPDSLLTKAVSELVLDRDLERHINSKRGYSALQRQALVSVLESGDSLLVLLRRRR